MKNKFILSDKEIKILIKSGCLAPSGGNIQPWRVKVHPNMLDISIDSKRSVSFIDSCPKTGIGIRVSNRF
ncbi:MAG: hypothetical protein UR52_C0002G0095 [Candidatus Gottesmanbacteria bacterium GW2011_GWA1_34_13]|uniref:Nitroreductase n=1 Tax=Candidatus Gottesmanbacteria bacterium GW2011_GWA1_34_13 TaxID=1618434 RepID=A0A0G0DXI9_9BACT|nr:MAG: hypothetical protein UR52_C0002G0095 [Candidatus Gottesmanbacteria bacterium GW2011_GWA1_34_13]